MVKLHQAYSHIADMLAYENRVKLLARILCSSNKMSNIEQARILERDFNMEFTVLDIAEMNEFLNAQIQNEYSSEYIQEAFLKQFKKRHNVVKQLAKLDGVYD